MSKLKIFHLLIVLLPIALGAQKIDILSPGIGSDSSLYHLVKISANEYWAGGKNGVLKRIDTLGNIQNIPYPSQGYKILKIEKSGPYVFIATDYAMIYRYDLRTKEFISREFTNFKNKAFYDLIVLDNGQVLVSGGSTAIVRSSKKFPMGFIALLDQDLKEIEVVWKSFRKFVWSIIQLPDGKIIAATFNGLNTKLIVSEDGAKKWKKKKKIKGLVHELSYLDNKLWYCGARSFYFFKYFWKNGILGIVDKKKYKLKGKACQWSMCMMGDKIATINTLGELNIIDKATEEMETIAMPSRAPLYDIELISKDKYLLVGQGKSIFILDLKD